MKSFEVINSIQKQLDSRGFKVLNSSGLISPVFPHTFNPSAAHEHVREVVNTQHAFESVNKYQVLERCIRQVDIPRLGDGLHLCLFEMIASVVDSSSLVIPVEFIIEQTLQIITDCLQLPKDSLAITCFGGARIGERIFEPDSASPNIWHKLGVKTILSVPGRSNFIYLESEGEAAGPRCEIYFRCDFLNQSARYMEIGSVIFDTHRFHKGRPVETMNTASGFAFGLERLLMTLNESASIYNSDVFEPLIELIIDMASDRNCVAVLREKMLITIDVLKGLFFILTDYPFSLSGQQRSLLLRLLHIARDGMFLVQAPLEIVLQDFSKRLTQMYGHRYPSLEINSQRTVRMLSQLLHSPDNKTLETVLN